MRFATVSTADHIAQITMSDPARRNALSAEMLGQMHTIFDELAPDTRVVVLRAGPGDAVWCAGFDIAALAPPEDPLAATGLLQGLFGRLRACRAPVIGMLHGSAWGGGADLALRCDWLMADETASLAFTPAKLGLPYDADGLLNAMGLGGRALIMEMFATAAPVDAERALRAGLVNRVVAEARLEAEVMAMARAIAANAPLTVTSAKRHLSALAAGVTLPDGVARSLATGRREALESADFREGLAAFRAKRRPAFTGR